MKKLILFSLLLLPAFYSCDTYVRVVSLRPATGSADSNTLVFENDTMRINYNFYGNSPEIGLTVFNKLSTPLYIDWERSSLIVGTQKSDYWHSSASVTVYHDHDQTSETVTLNQDERYAFIPPNVSIQRFKYLYLPVNYRLIPMKEKAWLKTNARNDSVSALETDFTPQTTPATFRNYLTFSTDSKFQHEFFIDHTFWICNIRDLKTRDYLGYQDDSDGVRHFTHPFYDPSCFYIIYDPQDTY